ncbi:hypothetical protein M3Y94_00398700 [Aphelenchoides besseyi]|nr:hypothetical protein M3Y94_00398700 [Aphelenchoides besseyi]
MLYNPQRLPMNTIPFEQRTQIEAEVQIRVWREVSCGIHRVDVLTYDNPDYVPNEIDLRVKHQAILNSKNVAGFYDPKLWKKSIKLWEPNVQ